LAALQCSPYLWGSFMLGFGPLLAVKTPKIKHLRADDLAQISFLKAYEQRGSLRDAKAAKSWLFQIAYRSFVDHHRKEMKLLMRLQA